MLKLINASIIAIAAAASLGGAALAQDNHIRIGDLDLSTAQGAATLDNRIAMAAGRVCAAESGGSVGLTGSAACERAFRRDALRAMPVRAQDQLAVARSSQALVSAR